MDLIFKCLNMNFYRKILKNAFLISWHNKYLWFFGIFATFLSTSGGYEMMLKVMLGGESSKEYSIADTGILTSEGLVNVKNLIVSSSGESLFFMGVTLLVLVGLVLFVVWVATVSQCAIVSDYARLTKAKVIKNEHVAKIKTSFDIASVSFWNVLFINVLNKVVLAVVFAVVGVVAVAAATSNSGFVFEALFVLVFMIFIALTLSIAFVAKFAIGYIVVKNKNFFVAVKMGFRLFVNNWIISLELAFMLFSLNFVIGLVVSLVTFVIAIPFTFFSLLLGNIGGAMGFWVVALPGIVTLVVIITVMGSLLTTFQISTWTGLFLELVGRKEQKSKILRVAENVKK